MAGFNHAQLRLIEQMYIYGDDPFAAPERAFYEEVYISDAAQEEETHTEKSPSASKD